MPTGHVCWRLADAPTAPLAAASNYRLSMRRSSTRSWEASRTEGATRAHPPVREAETYTEREPPQRRQGGPPRRLPH
jgi:hypothetical protein